ncbi:GNAT family N-acetyltransferase [Christiangramia sp. SM2212]|uniref:GNAT family N-acetyltransferase n=1 Tax=Christiangramia sediminicola TaxID=3073267 RepID=A0ABU1EN61_9FLAO|nr:GNAT family N-acetyltransferase [Christiangramia sp. SM2212]MDR5589826.1 GNAT family N-acetyltransferase [Christiangramia sp. SM2212]
MSMQIVSWKPEYSEEFRKMNIYWLEEFFWVEPHDEDVLGDPNKYIIDPGGTIFFALEENNVIGCVALMKIKEDIFELTKMAVKPEYRGKKIGHQLMQHSIEFATDQNWDSLIIYSNRKLENAIHLYRKYGFKEIPIAKDNPYSRGDIKMQLKLS